MSPTTIRKTIHQYSKGSIPEEDMQKLLSIAADYCKVRNYVYMRYGGISSLPKIYPGYAVQNEMTKSGLQESWQLPSVYFYLALFDALGDIRIQWTRTKAEVFKLIGENETFSEDEKHYLRFLLKVSNAFGQVLNQKPVELTKAIQEQYDLLAGKVEPERLQRYLCRQVRKYHKKLHTDQALGFTISERAYRYGNHGIYISTKEKRKRIFIPLTDHNEYRCQLYIKLYPGENRIVIHVPIRVAVRKYADYTHKVGVAYGMYTMLTTDEGHCYGEKFGEYQLAYAEWLQMQNKSYHSNRDNNPGRKKYSSQKNRLEEQLHSYINQELNRFLQTEKPQTIYVAKLPRTQQKRRGNKQINHAVTLWQRGYIHSRLAFKCQEQSIKLVEVFGKDISRRCSNCGEMGIKEEGGFFCPACSYSEEEKINTARNIRKRGQGEDATKRSLE